MAGQFDQTKILDYITINGPVSLCTITRHFKVIAPALVLDLTLNLLLERAVVYNRNGNLITKNLQNLLKDPVILKDPVSIQLQIDSLKKEELKKDILAFVRDAGSVSLGCLREHTLNDPHTGTAVLSLLASGEIYVNHNQHLVFNGYSVFNPLHPTNVTH
jgi:hypothetical protein